LVPQIASWAKVTILVSCLHICPFQTLLNFKKACNFKLLRLASELPLIPGREMIPMDMNLFVKFADDTEGSGGLAEEDKDLLKSLERMAAEIESEAESSR